MHLSLFPESREKFFWLAKDPIERHIYYLNQWLDAIWRSLTAAE
jgi:hypothetical protein